MKKKVIISIVIILVLAAVGGAIYFLALQDKGDESEPIYTYNIEDAFVTNVKDSNKLFKTTIVIVADSDQLADLLSKNQYIVRDTILFLLRDLTEEDIDSDTIQDTLRVEITDALNQALNIENITSVSFGDFVMQ